MLSVRNFAWPIWSDVQNHAVAVFALFQQGLVDQSDMWGMLTLYNPCNSANVIANFVTL